METTRPKRLKVTMACNPCRSRKIKCDGRQPICEPCQKRARSGTKCKYDIASVRSSQPKDYMKSLEDRIEVLEARGRHDNMARPDISERVDGGFEESFRSNSPEPRMLQSTTPFLPWAGSSFIKTLDPGTNPQATTSAASIAPATIPSLQDSRESTYTPTPSNNYSFQDMADDDNQTEHFAGSSSASIFMQEVEKMAIGKLGEASQSTSGILNSVHDSLSPFVAGHEPRQNYMGCILPPREQADKLMTSYWSYFHPFYPLLEKAQIEEDYDKMWDRGDSISEKQPFLCLLNSIFALSTRLVRSTTPNCDHSAATFYLRAQTSLNIEKRSIRSIQSYLVLAQYFHSIDESRMHSMFVALAIRAAQALGLHRFETSDGVSESRTKEIFRRVWHGCILMDREVSMLYGRPCLIDSKAAAAVPLPLFMDEHNLRSGHQSSHTIPLQHGLDTDFYVSSLRLYDILHDVLLNSNFNESQKRSQTIFENNASILVLQERLSRWENNIPDHLKIRVDRQYDGSNSLLVRRAYILQQRHLHIHLLLLRPVLANFVSFEFRNKGHPVPIGRLLSYRISLQCAIVCVKIAQEAIDTIFVAEAAGSSDTGSFSTSWHSNAVFLYTSATVLIAGRLSPSVVAEVSEEGILNSFGKAVAILRQHAVYSWQIRRLTTVLSILSNIVPEQYSRLRQASQQAEANAGLPNSDDSHNVATFQYWCPVRPVSRSSFTALPNVEALHAASKNGHRAPSHPSPSFNFVLDLENDFTWLTTMPFSK